VLDFSVRRLSPNNPRQDSGAQPCAEAAFQKPTAIDSMTHNVILLPSERNYITEAGQVRCNAQLSY